jgi:hypothetical protein
LRWYGPSNIEHLRALELLVPNGDNDAMSTDGVTAIPFADHIPADLMAELQAAADAAAKGVRDPASVTAACERMDRLREEVRQKHGVLNIGVPAIRELRGELPDG